MREVGHFIGGKQVPGQSGRTTEFFQPMTGEVIGRVALASRDELRQAVENAKAAQPAWAATNPQRRARVMMKFLELIAKENDSLAETLAREHGKTIVDAKGDIQRGVEVAEFAAASRISSRASSRKAPAPASTCIRSASRSAWSPASRRSTSRP